MLCIVFIPQLIAEPLTMFSGTLFKKHSSFNLLPAVQVSTYATADKASSGIVRLGRKQFNFWCQEAQSLSKKYLL